MSNYETSIRTIAAMRELVDLPADPCAEARCANCEVW
jgi:hypothetical protein